MRFDINKTLLSINSLFLKQRFKKIQVLVDTFESPLCLFLCFASSFKEQLKIEYTLLSFFLFTFFFTVGD